MTYFIEWLPPDCLCPHLEGVSDVFVVRGQFEGVDHHLTVGCDFDGHVKVLPVSKSAVSSQGLETDHGILATHVVSIIKQFFNKSTYDWVLASE